MHEASNTDPSTDDVVQLLLDLAPHAKVLKHIPGKITIKFSLSGLGVIQNASIRNFDWAAVPWIKKASTSLWRRSVVIEYDEAEIYPEIWEDLVSADHDPAKRNLLKDRLRAILEKPTE